LKKQKVKTKPANISTIEPGPYLHRGEKAKVRDRSRKQQHILQQRKKG